MAEQNQSRRLAGALLSASRHIVNAVTLVAAMAYLFASWWMHAPLADALQVVAKTALPALLLAWACGAIADRLRRNLSLLPGSRALRWSLGAAALALLVACGTAVLSMKRQYDCGIDPARSAAARERQARTDGFERVCEGDLARFDIPLGSLDDALGGLAFTPVDLAHTPFAAFKHIGGAAESIAGVPSRLYRGFRMPDGHRLILSEHDMSADGTRSWRDPQDEPERINGLAARLSVLQEPGGAAVSQLSWTEGRRSYELWVDANVARTPLRAQLLALAAALPKSVPGCPNEAPARPFGRAADGSPVAAPMPQALTRAEFDARAGKRPCR